VADDGLAAVDDPAGDPPAHVAQADDADVTSAPQLAAAATLSAIASPRSHAISTAKSLTRA
jgi:hypothetical protein